jgi:hypothetical protein
MPWTRKPSTSFIPAVARPVKKQRDGSHRTFIVAIVPAGMPPRESFPRLPAPPWVLVGSSIARDFCRSGFDAAGPSAIYHWIRGATMPQRLARERGLRLTLDEIYGIPANSELMKSG